MGSQLAEQYWARSKLLKQTVTAKRQEIEQTETQLRSLALQHDQMAAMIPITGYAQFEQVSHPDADFLFWFLGSNWIIWGTLLLLWLHMCLGIFPGFRSPTTIRQFGSLSLWEKVNGEAHLAEDN